MNKIIKNALILVAITLVSGICLGVVYEITKEPIAAAEEQAKIEAWQAVFPEADMDSFNPVDVDTSASEEAASALGIKANVDEVCEVTDLGYVVTVTDSEGFGGDIQITVGLTSDGTVNGISVLSISETAGLGMRADDPSFYSQYVGQNTTGFYVSKDGGNGTSIDALSGATITSRAFTGAVNMALTYYQLALAE